MSWQLNPGLCQCGLNIEIPYGMCSMSLVVGQCKTEGLFDTALPAWVQADIHNPVVQRVGRRHYTVGRAMKPHPSKGGLEMAKPAGLTSVRQQQLPCDRRTVCQEALKQPKPVCMHLIKDGYDASMCQHVPGDL